MTSSSPLSKWTSSMSSTCGFRHSTGLSLSTLQKMRYHSPSSRHKPKQRISMDNQNPSNPTSVTTTQQQKQQANTYLESLEGRLKLRSDQLENLHMEAAIDAQLTAIPAAGDSSTATSELHQQQPPPPIFDDYVNPHAVHNCLSPFVPTPSQRIEALLDWIGLQADDDVLLDIGCGDGRVCVAAAKLTSTYTVQCANIFFLCIGHDETGRTIPTRHF